MKPCPQCGELPLTVEQFVLKFDARKTKCHNCGTLLKGNRFLYVVFYCAIALGLCGAGFFIILEEIYGWPEYSAFLAFIGAVLIVGIPIEIVAWQKGAYEVKLENGKTQSTDAADS